MNDTKLKHRLLQYCHAYVDERISTASEAMASAQQSANEEGKSSAGDKYETGRAMMHIERDQAATQLAEAKKLKQVLDSIDADKSNPKVSIGSLVISRSVSIFVAIGIGKAVVDDKAYLLIAPQSPLGKAIINKAAGETYILNGEEHLITSVL